MLPVVLLGSLLIANGGCALEEDAQDEAVDELATGLRNANGDEEVTAITATSLKTGTQDASTLPSTEVCKVPSGAKVILRNPTSVGRHVTGLLRSAHGCGGKFGGGARVYVFRDHFSGWSSGSPAAPVDSGGLSSCSPQRANGVVPALHRTLLDTIAYAEGTRGRGQDGYNVQFSYVYFSSCVDHPRRIQSSGGYSSDAAGRYQFLSTTWDSLGYAAFTPDNQDRGGMKLVAQRGFSVPVSRAMNATEFSNLMSRISWEWASLPPGRYGQPSYSLGTMRAEYCRLAGC
jgi:muramidase (phage lysozyme)